MDRDPPRGSFPPEPSEAGIRRTLEQFVVDTSLITDELVGLRYRAAFDDTASDRLLQVVAARDRDWEAPPLDFDALSTVRVPVLLIHGTQDKVIPVSRTWEMLRTIPNADAYIFGRCGHWTQIEHAEEFNQVVGQYLARHRLAR